MPEASVDRAASLRPYLPRMLIDWLAEAPGTMLREVDGTIVFVDISGFTKMSERLARNGKVGAEEVTEVIGSVFARLLSVAYGEGGGLIKFGGDALLLLFTGHDHPIKGARAAVGMRKASPRHRRHRYDRREGHAADVGWVAQRDVPLLPGR